MKALTTYSKYLFVLITLLSLTSLSYAQQTAEQYIERTNYLLYLPEGYKADTITRWPLLIFLHGAGETGSNVERVKLHGPPKRIADGHKYPFIVISPQSAQYGWNSELIIRLLKDFMGKYRVDEDRVYLTGLSMGGYGTWSTAISYPEYFAAIIPICGGGQPEGVKRLKNMPVWCFHGAKDNVVPISQSEKMMTPLQAINPKAKFTVYPEADHDSWTETYNNQEIYDWLLSHKRFKYEEINIDRQLLEKYAGSYLFRNDQTVQISVEENRLKVRLNERVSYELKPFSTSEFFIRAEATGEVFKFVLDENGKVSHLVQETGRNDFTYPRVD
jgi:pimeloyl-ACP methyl ester carboxylesterase